MSQLVDAPPRVSTDDLRAELEIALQKYFPSPSAIVGLDRRPYAYGTSFALEALDVHFADGRRLPIVFKDLGVLLEPARRVKPAFLLDPVREIEVYRHLLTPQRIGTAICYGAVADPRLGRYWLFLEHVSGLELYQIGDFSAWEEVARWLARMHTRFQALAQSTTAARLLRYDARLYRLWIARATHFGKNRDSGQELARLAQSYDRVINQLNAHSSTIIHGDFYPSNILIGKAAEGLRVCPVDWEVAGIGPGLLDLAALVAGKWSQEEKTRLAQAYYDELVREQGAIPSFDEFLIALDYCRLQLAVQWLGWSRNWMPPAEHAQDWLCEALQLAGKLSLI